MAVIHDDLNIQTIACTAPADGLSTRGAIHASYHTLTTRFGNPDFGTTDTAAEEATLWILDTPAGRAHLQSWLDVHHLHARPHTEVRWSIQTASDGVLPWVFKAVTGSTAAFPAGVDRFARTSSRETLTAAYVDYLYLRSQAMANWVNLQHRDSRSYRENWTLPRHLLGFALQVQEILLHFQWSHADAAERLAWIGVGKPALPPAPDLDHWRRYCRWQFVPVPTEAHPDGGDPDLAANLRERAEDAAWARDHVVRPSADGLVRTRKVDLFDEHAATLTALAGSPVGDLAAGNRR
ncbi:MULTISPECIES: hypothetical protein [Amycolatopsis]|uniref:Uncharacterized protein n=1 Tax=Amycolatopsis saalfeldensis TaxID=394193 RepID=A0A1H8YQP0_9PSEU|nr:MULTISPECIES: hypothetical protein [Amycolatopsis]SEP53688.1 hypothetical protein SAMN04489732_129134 [Amycolatopsis saalfeldensis]